MANYHRPQNVSQAGPWTLEPLMQVLFTVLNRLSSEMWLFSRLKTKWGYIQHGKLKLQRHSSPAIKKDAFRIQISQELTARSAEKRGGLNWIVNKKCAPFSSNNQQALQPLVGAFHITLHLRGPELHKSFLSQLMKDNILRIHPTMNQAGARSENTAVSIEGIKA